MDGVSWVDGLVEWKYLCATSIYEHRSAVLIIEKSSDRHVLQWIATSNAMLLLSIFFTQSHTQKRDEQCGSCENSIPHKCIASLSKCPAWTVQVDRSLDRCILLQNKDSFNHFGSHDPPPAVQCLQLALSLSPICHQIIQSTSPPCMKSNAILLSPR